MTDLPQRQWQQTEPGIMSLLGTSMRIIYERHENGDFHVYQGDRSRYRYLTLAGAKHDAERQWRELEEIGVSP